MLTKADPRPTYRCLQRVAQRLSATLSNRVWSDDTIDQANHQELRLCVLTLIFPSWRTATC